jgi:hypothetical protein
VRFIWQFKYLCGNCNHTQKLIDVMKRLILFLFVFLFVLILPSQHKLYSITQRSDNPICPVDTIPIVGSTGGGEWGGIDPNGIPYIPIGCEFVDSVNCLVFSFYDDIGFVSVTIMNLSTSESWMRVLDSQLGIEYFPISGNSGIYNISIVTLSGNTYYGQFVI